MPDRFTAEQIRATRVALHAEDCSCSYCKTLAAVMAQAADTEEMVQKIASEDPALAAKMAEAIYPKWWSQAGTTERLSMTDQMQISLRALTAVLKHGA